MRKDYPVYLLCKAIGVSKSGYYAYLKQPKREQSDRDREDLERIIKLFNKFQGTIGAKHIAKRLRLEKNPCIINHKRVARLMKVNNLKVKVRRPRTTREAKEEFAGHVYENHLKRDFDADLPDLKWVTDMTEMVIDGEKFYISAILDLFHRGIIAHEVSGSPNRELITTTVKTAQANRQLDTLERVLIHSDRGSVYRSYEYHKLSKELKFTPSMSRKANCWDNAVIESFFSHLKVEFPCFFPNSTKETFKRDLAEYIKFYNEERSKARIGYLSPREYLIKYELTA